MGWCKYAPCFKFVFPCSFAIIFAPPLTSKISRSSCWLVINEVSVQSTTRGDEGGGGGGGGGNGKCRYERSASI